MKLFTILLGIICLNCAAVGQLSFFIDYAGAGPANIKTITFDAAIPSEHDFGVITNTGTVQFSLSTNCYALNGSGPSLSFNLPSAPVGAARIEGVMTNSYTTNQVVSIKVAGVLTRLIKLEPPSSVSSFTNRAGGYTRFIFFASKGAWSDFATIGDDL